MKPFLAFLGIVVAVVLLVSSSTIGGAFCIRGVGCLYSANNGMKLDRSNVVQVSVGSADGTTTGTDTIRTVTTVRTVTDQLP